MARKLYDDHQLLYMFRQIRLLKLDAIKHDQFGMIVCDLEHAPKFAAVSYTWGEPFPKSAILVDQKAIEITGNAKYALKQVVPRAFANGLQYVWIDSICIDQSSVADKNWQVVLMGAIYAGAAKVFACIGAHEDESEDVLKSACSLDLQRCLSVSSVRKFSHRSYWTRLWIVQELFQATSSPIILCGKDEISLSNLWFVLAGPIEQAHTGTPMAKVMRLCVLDRKGGIASRNKTRYCLGALHERLSSECTDPRDYVFALLSMVDWPEDLPQLAPDYSLTLTQLVYKVIPGLVPRSEPNQSDIQDHLSHLLQLFKITHPDELEDLRRELNVIARSRKHYRTKGAKYWLMEGPGNTSSVWISPKLPGQEMIGLELPCAGGFFRCQYNAMSVQPIMLNADTLRSALHPSLHSAGASLDECVGFTSASVQPGDWLVSTGGFVGEGRNIPMEYWFVLRISPSGKQFDVIGNAWLIPLMLRIIPPTSYSDVYFDMYYDGFDAMCCIVEHHQLAQSALAGSVGHEFLDCRKPNSFAVLV